jgi:hypothetical protein
MQVKCDYCGNDAEFVGGDVIYPHRPDLASKKFYACFPCDARAGCHPDHTAKGGGQGKGDTPLGRLANAELRKAKMMAHAAFDPLWRSGKMSRRRAYALLADRMGLAESDCHIGMFDVNQCHAVIRAASYIKSTFNRSIA